MGPFTHKRRSRGSHPRIGKRGNPLFQWGRIGCLVSMVWILQAQERLAIEGRVLDRETGRPLSAVNVYLANTTLGSATDETGYFLIRGIPKGAYTLVVTHIGYGRETRRIDLRASLPEPIEIRLIPIVLTAPPLEVTARDHLRREQALDRFMREFLGTSPNAKACRIVNPEILHFVDPPNGPFSAKAEVPLVVDNDALGYRIEILLLDFEIQGNDVHYTLLARFEDRAVTDPSRRAEWIKHRKEAWRGSLRHFLSLLATDRFHKGPFDVYRGMLDPETGGIIRRGSRIRSRRPFFIREEPIEGLKTISFRDLLIVQYRDFTKMHGSAILGGLDPFPTSFLALTVPSATINPYGNVDPYDAFKVYGAWAAHRVADLLPLDYNPETPLDE